MSKEKSTKTAVAPPTTTDTAAITSRINGLIQLRQQWENGANTTAKQQLYQLLQQCYQLHAEMRDSRTREEVRVYMREQGLRLRTNTSTISMVLRQVFSAKRRQVSAYNRALLSAEQQGIAAADFIVYITTMGGVENLRVQNNNTRPTVKQKSDCARTALSAQSSLAHVAASNTLNRLWDSSNTESYAVLLAVRNSDGSFDVHSVIQQPSLVQRALSVCANSATTANTIHPVILKQRQREAALAAA